MLRAVDRRPRPTRVLALLATALLTAMAVTAGAGSATAGAGGPVRQSAAPAVQTDQWYQLISWRSRQALGTSGGSTAAGAPVVQQTVTEAASQQVRFEPVGGGYYAVVLRHSSLALSIEDRGGARATQAELSGAASQQFSIAAGSSGRIKLINRASGEALEVAGASKVVGAGLTQSPDVNATHQQITLVALGAVDGAPTPAPEEPAPTPTPEPNPTTPGATSWPSATSTVRVTETIPISGTVDGKLTRYYGIGDGSQDEDQDPMFVLADGAVLRNVILGTGAGDGIHCRGTCTLENIWWEDVGEDAATFKGTKASQTMTIIGGGARQADDKVFQHNGPGTFIVRGFEVEDFGKLYRSCGNCKTQHARHVVIEDVVVVAPGKSVVGINPNLGDTARISGLTVVGDTSTRIAICEEYRGVTSGEPRKVSTGPSTACGYDPSAITYRSTMPS